MVKNLTLPRERSGLCPQLWEVISKPSDVLPDKSILVYLGALGHAGELNDVIYGGGGLGACGVSSPSKGLEPEVSHVPCVDERAPVKTLNTKVLAGDTPGRLPHITSGRS